MNKNLLAFLFILNVLSFSLSAQNAVIIYLKGNAEVLQAASGYKHKAWIGEKISYNDTLFTGSGARIDLQIDKDLVAILENTVFRLIEVTGKSGQKQKNYVCDLGQLKVKIERIAGEYGPRVTTGSSAAGVRGTEFTVFAGLDGSSLIRVSSGVVEVEAQGETIQLESQEAVEVKAGGKPGPKFVARDPIDYKSWNDKRFNEFLKDPIESLKNIEKLILQYASQIRPLWLEYEKLKTEIKKADEKFAELKASITNEEAKAYHLANIKPLEIRATQLYLDIRYNALSAFSLRRYVASRLYLIMKAEYSTDQQANIYLSFLNQYNSLLFLFNKEIVQFIGEQDI